MTTNENLVKLLELALPYLAASATDADGYRLVRDVRAALAGVVAS